MSKHIPTLAPNCDCTGCGACRNACPVDAIDMVADIEGFLQPVVDQTKCIGCGKCSRSCPILSDDAIRPIQIEKQPICGCSKSEITWRKSTSGGAFTEICESLSDESPIVFGARFEGLRVVHDCVDGADKIGPFRKSKYVQSDIGLTLRRCREYLDQRRFVIYSGTPCQIAGLRAFLSKDYSNLLTIEFICHGAGSPGFFKACLDTMEKKFGKKIVKYGFRSKERWPVSNQYTSCYGLEDGHAKLVEKDLYNSFFLSQLCLRKSCMENCQFRTPQRFADITLADSRNESSLYPDKDDKNWSVIVANTDRGRAVVDKLTDRMELHPYPISLLEKTNPLYFHTTPGNPRRDEFFELYKSGQSLVAVGQSLGVLNTPISSFLLKTRRSAGRCYRAIKRTLGV